MLLSYKYYVDEKHCVDEKCTFPASSEICELYLLAVGKKSY